MGCLISLSRLRVGAANYLNKSADRRLGMDTDTSEDQVARIRLLAPKLGKRLYDGYAGPKILEVIPWARHSSTTDETPDWWKELLAFWQQHPVGPTSPDVKQTSAVAPHS